MVTWGLVKMNRMDVIGVDCGAACQLLCEVRKRNEAE